MFTGDRSGDFLYRSLFRAGFASQPESRAADDGLELRGAWITASAHCAPPDNKPTREELRNCRPFFTRELELLVKVQLVVVLGKIAMDTYLAELKRSGRVSRAAPYRFGHGELYAGLQPALLCSYHPSQQNTSTGRLTQEMLDEVFLKAREIVGQAVPPAPLRSI
jgi:uracil-DNA glycosylase family 4